MLFLFVCFLKVRDFEFSLSPDIWNYLSVYKAKYPSVWAKNGQRKFLQHMETLLFINNWSVHPCILWAVLSSV